MLRDTHKNFKKYYEDDGEACFISKKSYILNEDFEDFGFNFEYKYAITVKDIYLITGDENSKEIDIELYMFPTFESLSEKNRNFVKKHGYDEHIMAEEFGIIIRSKCIVGNNDYYPTNNLEVVEIVNDFSKELENINENLDNYLYRMANYYLTNLDIIRENVTGEVRR